MGIDTANTIVVSTDTSTSADVDQSASKRRSLAPVWIGARQRVVVSTDVPAVTERWSGVEYIWLNLSCRRERGGRAKRDRKRNEKNKNKTKQDGEERTMCE